MADQEAALAPGGADPKARANGADAGLGLADGAVDVRSTKHARSLPEIQRDQAFVDRMQAIPKSATPWFDAGIRTAGRMADDVFALRLRLRSDGYGRDEMRARCEADYGGSLRVRDQFTLARIVHSAAIGVGSKADQKYFDALRALQDEHEATIDYATGAVVLNGEVVEADAADYADDLARGDVELRSAGDTDSGGVGLAVRGLSVQAEQLLAFVTRAQAADHRDQAAGIEAAAKSGGKLPGVLSAVAEWAASAVGAAATGGLSAGRVAVTATAALADGLGLTHSNESAQNMLSLIAGAQREEKNALYEEIASQVRAVALAQDQVSAALEGLEKDSQASRLRESGAEAERSSPRPRDGAELTRKVGDRSPPLPSLSRPSTVRSPSSRPPSAPDSRTARS